MDVYSYDNVSGKVITTTNYTLQIGGDIVSNGAPIPELEALVGAGIEKSLNNVPQRDFVTVNPATKNLTGAGGIFSLTEVSPYVNMTASGIAVSGPCELAGYDCTVAAGNITIYDNTSASGTVIVPTTALAVGRTEFGWKRALLTGCYVVLSGAATVNVLVG